VGPDLYVAAQEAVKAMIRYLGDTKGIEPYAAYMMCSVTQNLLYLTFPVEVVAQVSRVYHYIFRSPAT
jgi:acetamidase/formamidase